MACATNIIERRKYAKKMGISEKIVMANAMGFMKAMKARKDFVMSHPKKIEIARKILNARKNKKCITFSATIKDAEKLANRGEYILHSKKSKKQNSETIDKFNEIANDYKDIMFFRNWGHYDDRYSFEILSINASKGDAMNYLKDLFKCDLTIAFGDQLNDISMLQMANYGVAMINAKPEVKEKAKYTTRKDFNNNGVIDFLKNMSKNSYKSFSYYYDEIMELIEYDGWVDLTKKYLKPNDKILDLACGSGTLAISLANSGYDVSGLDLSAEIINVAKEKAKMNHVDINFSIKDMTNFSYEEKFDVITCYFDSVNFLTTGEVSKMMDCVYNNLNDGGYFIFDLFTLSKMKEFNNLTIKDNLALAKYKWKMKVKGNTIFHKLIIDDGKNKVVEKYHEYYHDLNSIIDSRFKVISITTDFKDTFSLDDERILIVLQK